MITSQWCLSQIRHQKTAKFATLKVSGLGLYMKCSSNVIYYFRHIVVGPRGDGDGFVEVV